MPDKKITDLVDGAPLQPTDEFVVARGGDNFKIDGSEVVAAVTKHDVTLAGNTAGALALVSSGTMTLAGGNNITLSQAGNAVTISGGAGGAETQTAISGISASDALYTSGTVRFTGVGGGVTVSSNTGQRVDISVAAPVAQTVQTQNVHNVTLSGNTAGALAEISSGTLTLAGGNNITVSQAGNAVTISGPNVGGAQTGISAIANSETTYTSGSVTLSALGAVTIRSTTGQHFQISVNSQSVQPETQTFIAGISASDTLYTSGNVRITGVGGGVTVSSNTGQRVDISVAAQSVQPETQTFIGGISASNTLYTSGSVRFTGSQAVTVRSGTGQLVVIDAPAQTAQTGISGIANSQTTYTSGTVSLSELGAITIRSTTGNQYQLSVNSQTVQTQGVLSVGVSTGGNTAGNTTVNTGSRFVIVGSNGITASQGTAAGATTVTLSGVTQSVQTNDIPRLGASNLGNTAGNTTVNSGTRFVLVGTNMVSLSQATAASATTISIDATQSVQTQGVLSVGASNIGNTSGNTTVNTGSRLVFAGGNNITISQGTAAGATTLTISAPNLGAGAMSAGASNLGNTAGSTGITGTQLVLVGSDNITLSQSTGANGGTVSIIAGGGGGFSAGVSTGGNTAGDTGVTGTRMVFVGTGPISLSQATAAAGGTISVNAPATSSLSATGLVSISTNGSTISIGVPGDTLSYFDPNGNASKIVGVFPGNASLAMQPWTVAVPYCHDRVVYPVQYSQATNSTLTVTVSAWFGLYTRNASTLSLFTSGSNTFSINGSGTASSAQNSGLKFLTFGWTDTISPGDYWLGAVSRTTTAGANASLSNVAINHGVSNSAWSGLMGVAANSTNQIRLGLGTWTVTTAGMPNSVAFSHLAGSATAAHRAPWVWFLSQTV